MKISASVRRNARGRLAGLTLIEVVVALGISVVLVTGIFKGYLLASRRAIYTSYSVAAQALAMKQMEQIADADWSPNSGITNIFDPVLAATQTNALGMPGSSTNLIYATNYASVTQVSSSPPTAMIRVDCVWSFMDMGTFTNTVAIIRGPDQP
jgi:type II secretory pathway pseudopilin PulG